MENWKDVKGYEGSYQVSDLGNVRSLDRVVSDGRKIKGRLLKPCFDSYGYLIVCLSFNNKIKTRTVHRLVAVAFLEHEPCGFKLVIDHVDNDKLNNKLDNLQLISQRENTTKDRVGGTSKHIGVSFYKKYNKYVTRCWDNGKRVFLGYFDTETEASEAYNSYLKKII